MAGDSDIVKKIILEFETRGEQKAAQALKTLQQASTPRSFQIETAKIDKQIESFNKLSGQLKEFPKLFSSKLDEFLKKQSTAAGKAEAYFNKRAGEAVTGRSFVADRREDRVADDTSAIKEEGKKHSGLMDNMVKGLTALGYRIMGVTGPMRGAGAVAEGGETAFGAKVMKPAGMIAGAAVLAGATASAYLGWKTAEKTNEQVLNEYMKGRVKDYYATNFERSALEVVGGSQSRINDYLQQTQGWRDVRAGGKIATGLASLGVAAATATGAGPLALPIAGSAAFYGAGQIQQGAQYFGAGGRGAETLRARIMMEGVEASKSMLPEFAGNLRGSAARRFDEQRLLDRSDFERLQDVSRAAEVDPKTGRKAWLREQDMVDTQMAIRQTLGYSGERGADAALAVGRYRMEAGVSLGTSQQFFGRAALAAGSSANTEEQLIRVLGKAVRIGIKDSGLQEGFTEAVIRATESTGARISTDYAAESMQRGLAAIGGADTSRDIKTVQDAKDLAEQMGKGDLYGKLKWRGLVKFMNEEAPGGFDTSTMYGLNPSTVEEGLNPEAMALKYGQTFGLDPKGPEAVGKGKKLAGVYLQALKNSATWNPKAAEALKSLEGFGKTHPAIPADRPSNYLKRDLTSSFDPLNPSPFFDFLGGQKDLYTVDEGESYKDARDSDSREFQKQAIQFLSQSTGKVPDNKTLAALAAMMIPGSNLSFTQGLDSENLADTTGKPGVAEGTAPGQIDWQNIEATKKFLTQQWGLVENSTTAILTQLKKSEELATEMGTTVKHSEEALNSFNDAVEKSAKVIRKAYDLPGWENDDKKETIVPTGFGHR